MNAIVNVKSKNTNEVATSSDIESRVDFPGFQTLEYRDNVKTGFMVDRGILTIGEGFFHMDMGKSQRAPSWAPFMVLSVAMDRHGQRVLIWGAHFDGDQKGSIRCFLTETDFGPAIGFEDIASRTLIRAYPVADLPLMTRMRQGSTVTIRYNLERTPSDLIAIKDQAARYLEIPVSYADDEQRFLDTRDASMVAQIAAKREQRLQETQARNEQRRIAKQQRLKALLDRPVYSCLATATGIKRHGIPVLSTEEEGLPNNTFAVLVDSYDERTGTVGTPISAFVVRKTPGGRHRRENETPVKAIPNEAPASHGAEDPTMPEYQRRTAKLFRNGKMLTVPVLVFANTAGVNAARDIGLPEGTYVTSEKSRVSSNATMAVYQICQIKTDRVHTVGNEELLPE